MVPPPPNCAGVADVLDADERAVERVRPRAQAPIRLAEVVAARIEADVIGRGWPTGEVIGSEADLLERHRVSRGVLREAIRLVEHKQIARMRRGPGGGLVVTEPDQQPVIDAVSVYVRFADVRLHEVFEARKVIEEAAAAGAAATLGEGDIAALRREHASQDAKGGPADVHELHRRIAVLSANPAFELFSGVLTRLTALYVGQPRQSAARTAEQRAASHGAHGAIVDAMCSGDPGLAAYRMRSHLDAVEAILGNRTRAEMVQSELLGARREGPVQSKLAEDLARSLFREVAARGWPVGEVLGSERHLIERHDVSRAVLREAVRLLEYHQIARMRRGPGGGLVVTEPGAEAVADAMTIFLEFRGITPVQLHEVRVVLELAAVDGAIARLDAPGRKAIESCVDRESHDRRGASLNAVSHDLHLLLAEMAGNRLVALFLRNIVDLAARHIAPGADDRPVRAVADQVQSVHRAVADAVIAGDRDLARHRMRKHLAALVPYYS